VARVFGSVARGEADDASDVDFLVDFEPGAPIESSSTTSLEAIERIERYAVRGRQAFDEDELIQNWITHQPQIIGEAVAHITTDLREAHLEVPWRQIGMRNVLTHDNFDVDLDIVWSVVEPGPPVRARSLSDLSALPVRLSQGWRAAGEADRGPSLPSR